MDQRHDKYHVKCCTVSSPVIISNDEIVSQRQLRVSGVFDTLLKPTVTRLLQSVTCYDMGTVTSYL